MNRSVFSAAAILCCGMFISGAASAQDKTTARFATFNIWRLSTDKLNEIDDNGAGANAQLRKAAEIIQRVRPDVLLVNEIDFDPEHRKNAERFRDRYLKIGQNGQQPIEYPHIFFAPVNTGVPTGYDLDRDGKSDGPGDAFGFGGYPGEYGMALYSRFPIDSAAARTFQNLLWKDMPKNLMPDGAGGKADWYSPEQAAILRLSSKSHWDVPVRIGGTIVHVLAAHPTPPVFDGDEDRNGRRNFDEVRLWADYISGGSRAEYIKDDSGKSGGLEEGALFVVMGDLNADPVKADKPFGQPAIDLLLKNPRIADPTPSSAGAEEFEDPYPGDKATRTSDFGRLDYVLPCTRLRVKSSGVFWPASGDPLHALVSDSDRASDHRLVWVDLVFPPPSTD